MGPGSLESIFLSPEALRALGQLFLQAREEEDRFRERANAIIDFVRAYPAAVGFDGASADHDYQ